MGQEAQFDISCITSQAVSASRVKESIKERTSFVIAVARVCSDVRNNGPFPARVVMAAVLDDRDGSGGYCPFSDQSMTAHQCHH